MEANGINIGLTSDDRGRVVGVLNAVLSDEVILYHRTRKYHWLVCGREFVSLHRLFQEQYEEAEKAIDEVAERIVALGGVPNTTFEEYVQSARLKEERHDDRPDAESMAERLCADHEMLVSSLRDDVNIVESEHGDRATSDFLSELLNAHLKTAWMLRALRTRDEA